MARIFITGASGCVGHYLTDILSPGNEVYLYVRSPQKLLLTPSKRENIHVIRGDLDEIATQADLLSEMDYCVHAATTWGGEATERINVQRTHELLDLLNPERVKRVVYFSTASVLGRDLQILPEAEEHGTDYIRTKSICLRKLADHRLYDRIVTVFPTLIFGGDKEHPYSHLSKALTLLKRYSWIIGRIRVDTCFHFIHAKDIAKIVRYLLTAPGVERRYVLGNEAISLGALTKRVAEYFGKRIRWQIKFSPQGIFRLARVLGAEISAWDRFCLDFGDFCYPVINCPSLGLDSDLSDIEGILSEWEAAQALDRR